MRDDMRDEAIRRGYYPGDVASWDWYDRDPYDWQEDQYRTAEEIIDDFEDYQRRMF